MRLAASRFPSNVLLLFGSSTLSSRPSGNSVNLVGRQASQIQNISRTSFCSNCRVIGSCPDVSMAAPCPQRFGSFTRDTICVGLTNCSAINTQISVIAI